MTVTSFRGLVEYKSLLQGIREHNGEQSVEEKLHGDAGTQQDNDFRWGVLGVSAVASDCI